MSLFTDISRLFTVDKKDIECINVDVENLGAVTNYYYVDMHTYRNLSFFFDETTGTGTATLTVEASNDEDAQGDADYSDVTTDLFGAASYTADAFKFNKLPITAKWIRFKVVTAGGSSDNDYKLVARKSY